MSKIRSIVILVLIVVWLCLPPTISHANIPINGSFTVSDKGPLTAIEIRPDNPTIALGRTQQFTAIGLYPDNLTEDLSAVVTWTSTNPSIATIDSTGLAQSLVEGQTTITVTSGNVSGTTKLTVTVPVLDFIAVTPANFSIAAGRTQQFTAIGTYSDGSTPNIADTVKWTSSNTGVVSLSATGLATSYNAGIATITGTKRGIRGTATLTVTEAVADSISVAPAYPTIVLGGYQQFRAIGIYSDGSKVDISTIATWTSDDTSVATIDANTGLATSQAGGITVITAKLSGKSGTSIITVIAAALQSIAVTPTNPSVAAGRTHLFTAIGTYSDGSTANLTSSVTWDSSNTTTARINAAGLAISYTPGTTDITASKDGVSSPSTTFTVTQAVLDSVTVEPLNPTIAFVSGNPLTLQFTTTASYSDGKATIITDTVSWTSINTYVATIGANAGLATTAAAGTTTITAIYNGKTGSTTLTVLADTVSPKITLISPADGLIVSGESLTVSGTVDDLAATTSIVVNGDTTIVLTIDNQGSFSKSVLLNVGSNTVLVRAVDINGNTGTSGTRTVMVDPKRPNITIIQPSSEILTNNPSLRVTGTVSGSITLAILAFNGVSQPVTVLNGSFMATITLVEGVNAIVVYAYATGHEDDNNYLGTSGVRTVTLDTTPPGITIDSPMSGSVVSNPGIRVSGRIDDPNVTMGLLTLNHGAPQLLPVIGGSFSQIVTLVPGTNTITVVATDEISNTSSIASPTMITLDTASTRVTITAPANKLVTNIAGQAVTGYVNDPTITTATLYVNGVPQTISVTPDGSFSKMVILTTGANTLEVRATDSAILPNISKSGVVDVMVDNTPPKLTINLTDPTDSISITVISNEALIATPTVAVNLTIPITQTGVNKWSGTYGSIGTPITDGKYIVTAIGTDKAGNSSTATATFSKQVVTIAEDDEEVVTTDTTKLQISTTANITDALISVTQHLENPAENAESDLEAGIFLEIVASPELRDNLESIYIQVGYDEAKIRARGIDESTLMLYLWHTATGQWQVVPDSSVNTTENYVYGTATHLSKFGCFGTAVQEEETEETIEEETIEEETIEEETKKVATSGFRSVTDLRVNSRGIVQKNYLLNTLDQKTSLYIARGTRMLNSQNNTLDSLSVVRVASSHAPPVQIAWVYDFSPDGAIFDPPITLTMRYNPESLLDRAIENELYIAYWSGSQWSALKSTVDTGATNVSAEISHFTQFTLIGTLAPTSSSAPMPIPIPSSASFTVSDLSVAPGEVELAEQVTISVLVSNTGGSQGNYSVVLKINGVEEARQEVTLGAGKNETVIFSIAKDKEGTYTVNIDGKVGQFTVTVLPPPMPTPTETLPVQLSTNWWFIGGIIASCVVSTAGLLVYLFVWRKRRA